MSEFGSAASTPGPELLGSQLAGRHLSKILLDGSSFMLNQVEFGVPTADADQVRIALAATSLEDMVVGPEEPLKPDPTRYTRPLHDSRPFLTPGINANMEGVSIGTWGRMSEKVRFVSIDQAAEFMDQPDVHIVPLTNSVRVEWSKVFE